MRSPRYSLIGDIREQVNGHLVRITPVDKAATTSLLPSQPRQIPFTRLRMSRFAPPELPRGEFDFSKCENRTQKGNNSTGEQPPQTQLLIGMTERAEGGKEGSDPRQDAVRYIAANTAWARTHKLRPIATTTDVRFALITGGKVDIP
jgi:hypothetical protein